MRSHMGWRSRPAAENLLFLAIAACLAIAAVRAVLVIAAVPAAFYANSQASVAAGSTTSTETVLERIGDNGAWKSWWGGRVVPFREGGDYIGVMWYSQPTRTVGSVIGVLVERDRALGIRIDRVLVPTDETALFGRPPGALFTRPDGTTFRSQWAHVNRYCLYFTDVPVLRTVYDPVLTPAAYTTLVTRTRLTLRAHDFYTAAPAAGGSGTWQLFSRAGGSDREYFLVPIETMQAGGAS